MMTKEQAKGVQMLYALTDKEMEEVRGMSITKEDLDNLPAMELYCTDDEIETMVAETVDSEQYDDFGEELKEVAEYGLL